MKKSTSPPMAKAASNQLAASRRKVLTDIWQHRSHSATLYCAPSTDDTCWCVLVASLWHVDQEDRCKKNKQHLPRLLSTATRRTSSKKKTMLKPSLMISASQWTGKMVFIPRIVVAELGIGILRDCVSHLGLQWKISKKGHLANKQLRTLK